MENNGINKIEEALNNPNFTIGRYPIGDSSFTQIREEGKIYVDKTAELYQLVNDSKYYFLSRPRRFGKSLMLSTLKAFFEGHKELFDGLAMGRLETEWRQHPVIHLSMGGKDFSSLGDLKIHLNAILGDNEFDLNIESDAESPETRFKALIKKAHNKYGQKVVILVDEYDKPILDTRYKESNLHEDVKSLLRAFYGCIKEAADHIRFVMITGITKFSHVNIFSGLNNLRDISLLPEYNAICGITESEMAEYFSEDIAVFAQRNCMTPEDAKKEIKLQYDGYRFASEGENIYNPFSTLNAFANMRFGSYWFQSGTSRYLVEELQQNHYDFSNLDGVEASEYELSGAPEVTDNPVGLLYQSGYLTIKDYEYGTYILGFPNHEVSSGFYNELLKIILPQDSDRFNALSLYRYANLGEPEKLMQQLQLGLSKFNCMQIQKPEYEYQFKTMLHAIVMASGLDVESEVLTPAGRIDMVVRTLHYIYLIEFKIDSTPEAALRQIDSKDYPFKYYGDPRPIYKIGANFSTELRRLTGWIIS